MKHPASFDEHINESLKDPQKAGRLLTAYLTAQSDTEHPDNKEILASFLTRIAKVYGLPEQLAAEVCAR